MMMRREEGFSLVELLITMVIFVFAIAAASSVFTGLLTQFKQQSKIVETNIEGAVGLEFLVYDLQSAGYGLPWANLPAYAEATGDPGGLNDASGSAPKGINSANSWDIVNGSDRLTIKAANVCNNTACKKWTNVRMNNVVRVWTPAFERLENNNRVIVIDPGVSGATMKTLIQSGAAFFTLYNNDTLSDPDFVPTSQNDAYLVYGIDDNTNLLRPFNRADYFISYANVPARCAPGTGVLLKAVLNQGNGNFNNTPILDCVADMQVSFRLDTDGDGIPDTSTNALAGLANASDIRSQVKEVRVYILAHEGQMDTNYTHPVGTIQVGETVGLGQNFVLGANRMNYRWKIYTIFVKTENLQ
ncbi:MAG: PilW family protein [Nitrospiraceae bacterium]|nr:PilW family protein [Nitrospiraceae bacterium]